MANLSAISLFTGAGGLDLGFEAAGFETRVAIEMDERCVETLRANRAWPVIARDVGQVSTQELLATAGLAKGEADVLIGGPPCQPFSKAGFWASGKPSASTIRERQLSTITFVFSRRSNLGPFFWRMSKGLAFVEKMRVYVTSTTR